MRHIIYHWNYFHLNYSHLYAVILCYLPLVCYYNVLIILACHYLVLFTLGMPLDMGLAPLLSRKASSTISSRARCVLVPPPV